MARIAKLLTYPVKGCAGLSVPASRVLPTGLEHDRAFATVDVEGVGRTQRRDPRLALVRAEPREDGRLLRLSAPGVPDLELPVALDGRRLEVTVLAWQGKVVDQGDAAAEWFTEVLGAPTRLVRTPPEHHRPSAGVTRGLALLSDSTAALIISESTLDLLNERLADTGKEMLPMNRFRPNLVISGWAEPHLEDEVLSLRAGEAEFGYAKPCIRCAVTLVDQEAGRAAGPEPLRTLAGYRRHRDGGVAFGMKAAVNRTGRISVGDEVSVRHLPGRLPPCSPTSSM